MSPAGETEKAANNALEHVARWEREVNRSPVVMVATDRLVVTGSPRTEGADHDHVRTLAEAEAVLPPITVHRRTLRVIDGLHRLRAAILRGQPEIAVRFFDGEPEDAFILSVAANTTHGLPLSWADRLAAARRIVGSHPEWSDRAIARLSGVSAKKVAEVREECAGTEGPNAVRVGSDGRARPVNSARGRELASRLIRDNPAASLRQIARLAGISPATVADVRDRLRQGTDPVPMKLRSGDVEPKAGERRSSPRESAPLRRSRPVSQLHPVFETLCKDPSLRFSDTGRLVLRLFDSCSAAAREWQRIVDNVPTHCRGPVAELLSSYGEMCHDLALELGTERDLASRRAV
ncbi:putative Streptomycin biosynthesis operon possible regulatory protein [Streptomyces afghaniensis 772] [Streptomyces afghaniensis]